jgi:hypothetical protein
MMRLMELANIEIFSREKDVYVAKIISRDLDTARKLRLQIIQWVGRERLNAILKIPSGLSMKTERGLVESSVKKLSDERYQFVRKGFVKLMERSDKRFMFLFMHE